MAHLNSTGLWQAERAHSPCECSEVECKDCFELVEDADEEFCYLCGDPLCVDCAQILNDEPLCAGCYTKLKKTALATLRQDTLVGDLFREAA